MKSSHIVATIFEGLEAHKSGVKKPGGRHVSKLAGIFWVLPQKWNSIVHLYTVIYLPMDLPTTSQNYRPAFRFFYVFPKLNLPDYENNQVKIRWIGNDDVGGKRHGARKKT